MPSGFLLLRRLALALASCLGSLCFLGFLSLGSIPLVAFGLPFAIAFAAGSLQGQFFGQGPATDCGVDYRAPRKNIGSRIPQK